MHPLPRRTSLWDYCLYDLGFSENVASNRIAVARESRRFPQMLALLREGRIHLSGLRMLCGHLASGDSDADVLLAAAAGKTKREIEELLARRSPKPAVPDQIRKLPQPRLPNEGPTAQASMQTHTTEPLLAAPSCPPPVTPPPPRAVIAPLSPEAYKVQFTASPALRDMARAEYPGRAGGQVGSDLREDPSSRNGAKMSNARWIGLAFLAAAGCGGKTRVEDADGDADVDGDVDGDADGCEAGDVCSTGEPCCMGECCPEASVCCDLESDPLQGCVDTGWCGISDRDRKEAIRAIEPNDVLERVATLPVSTWSYRGENVRHLGPMAQDFRAAFGLGSSERMINFVDEGGVALAAIQALYERTERLAEENRDLRADNADLRERVRALGLRLREPRAASTPREVMGPR